MSESCEMSLKEYLDSKDTIPDFHLIKREYRGLLEETERLRKRVEELEALMSDYEEGVKSKEWASIVKDAERWRDKRSISNKITDVVAAQLHYFDEIENVHLSTCNADEIAIILDGAIGRYRSDPKFHAKVTSMVAQLMQRLYETDAAIDAAMEADKKWFDETGEPL